MLWTIAVLLLLLWMIGLVTAYTLGHSRPEASAVNMATLF
jgi:hypothetical protein